MSQDLSTKLFNALHDLLAYNQTLIETLDNTGTHYELRMDVIDQAKQAKEDYIVELGPLPEWAVAHNVGEQVVIGAQLCTKDGRRHGNAHIVGALEVTLDTGVTTTYHCITDAGNEMHLSHSEINSEFYIGKYISSPGRIWKEFGYKLVQE